MTTKEAKRRRALQKQMAKSVRSTNLDPTRTLTLRSSFANELTKRMNRLRFEVYELIVTDDALGLKDAEPLTMQEVLALNAFCPTGEGGGVDPTCSPAGSQEGKDKVTQKVEWEAALGKLDKLKDSSKKELADYIKSIGLPGHAQPSFSKDKMYQMAKDTINRILVSFAQTDHILKMGNKPDPASNVFCPTGPGGGVDPTCSPGEGGAYGGLGAGGGFRLGKAAAKAAEPGLLDKFKQAIGLSKSKTSGKKIDQRRRVSKAKVELTTRGIGRNPASIVSGLKEIEADLRQKAKDAGPGAGKFYIKQADETKAEYEKMEKKYKEELAKAEQLYEQTFGSNPEAVASLVGAPDNAKVSVYFEQDVVTQQMVPQIITKGAGFDSTRAIRVEPNGERIISNLTFYADKTGTGIGTRVFAEQVANAREQGFSKIRTLAAGKAGTDENGYYTWALFGYDAPLSDYKITSSSVVAAAKAKFPEAKTVQDIMAAPGGREWWKANGTTFSGEFDLKDGSRSLQVLETYLDNRGKRLTQNVGMSDFLEPPEPQGDTCDLSEEEIAEFEEIWRLYLEQSELAGNAEQWKFNTNPEKVKAFQAWLKKQLKDEVLGKEEDEIWRRYALAGFKKGAGRAFDDSRKIEKGTQKLDFYNGTKAQFLHSSFAKPVAIEKVKLLAGRTYTEMEGITDAMAQKMTRVLTDGLVEGKSPRAIATDLTKEVDGIGKVRARALARTEIIRAHAEGQLQALEDLGVEEVGVMVEWSTSGLGTTAKGNPSPCDKCAPLQGVLLKIAEAHGMLPRHPNCVLPGNYMQGRVTAALKAHYSGEAVEILTANGARVTLTINHPVLTVEGFRPAGLLEKGRYLVGYQSKVKPLSSNIENGPAFIEEIFESFNTTLFKESTLAFDFDGDEKSMVGEVEVVLPSLPLGKLESFQRQSKDQVFLVPASDSGVGSINLVGSLSLGHSLPNQESGFAHSPDFYTSVDEPLSNHVSTKAKAVSDSLFMLPSQVASADKLAINSQTVPDCCRFGSASELDVPFQKPASNSVTLDTDLAAELVKRFPGQVTLDQVVQVSRFHYAGPVYDVETTIGYFTAGQDKQVSIITKNCMCAWIPGNVGEDQADTKLTKKEIKEALEESLEPGEEWGPAEAIAKDRPKSVLNVNVYGEDGKPLVEDAMLQFSTLLDNVFCPTGPGGGIDPTCSPGGAKSAKDESGFGGFDVELPSPDNITIIKSLPGSTGPKHVKDEAGNEWVMKKLPEDRIKNEKDADNVYKIMGVAVPTSIVNGGAKFNEFLEGATTLKEWQVGKSKDEIEAMHKEISKGFVLDAVLANWDVVGLSNDNIMIKDGVPYRIDNGGALKYRAQGGLKGVNFTPEVKELNTMRDPSTNPTTASIYKSLTEEDIQQQIKEVVGKKDFILAQITDPETKEIMDDRIADLASKLPVGTKLADIEKEIKVGKVLTKEEVDKAQVKPPKEPEPTSKPLDLTKGPSEQGIPTGKGYWDNPASISEIVKLNGSKDANFNELYMEKLKFLNPQGIKNGVFIAPKISGNLKDPTMLKQLEELKKILPPGTTIRLKQATANEMAKKAGITPGKKGGWKESFEAIKKLKTEEGGEFTFTKAGTKEAESAATKGAKSVKVPDAPTVTPSYKPTTVLPEEPTFASSNKVNTEANLKAVAELKELAKAGNVAAIEAHAGTLSPKVQAYKAALVEAIKNPPAPPKVYAPGEYAGGFKSSVTPGVDTFDPKYLPKPTDGKIKLVKSPDYDPKVHAAWVKSLTNAEQNAIGSWKGSATSIRDSISSGNLTPKAANFLSAITKSPPYQGVVYRGMHGEGAAKVKKLIESSGVGGIFSDNAPHCMSIDPGIARHFNGGGKDITLRIKTLTGRPIQGASGFESEKELVGMPGTQYKIAAIYKDIEQPGLNTGYGSQKKPYKYAMLVDLEEIK